MVDCKICGHPYCEHAGTQRGIAIDCANYMLLQKPQTNAEVARKWIPVTERLPEKQADVVALSNKDGGYMFVGYRGYISGEWMENGILHIGDVTHWMPLPEPPKGE